MIRYTLLFLIFFTFLSCQESKKPIVPSDWLTKVKDSVARDRTKDVLEKIYNSTAYTISEKDSLSQIQVQLANCEFPDSIRSIGYFLRTTISLEHVRYPILEFLSTNYKKDSSVAKAALSVLIDTTKVDFGRYFPKGYNSKTYTTVFSTFSSKELIDIENKIASFSEIYPTDRDSVYLLKKLIKKALSYPKVHEYGFPKLAKQLNLKVSPDKKLYLYSYMYAIGANSSGSFGYAHYQSDSINILKDIAVFQFEDEDDNFQFTATPLGLFQMNDKGKTFYIVVYEHYGGGIDGSFVVVQIFHFEDGKFKNCEDCIENKKYGMYSKSVMEWIVPVFDSLTNELTFNSTEEKYLPRLHIPEAELDYIRSNRIGSTFLTERTTLKWNGKTFEKIPFKPYCNK